MTTDIDDTDMDIDLGSTEPEGDPTNEHREHLQREVDRLTDAINNAIAFKTANAKLIKSLRAQRTPLERAIRAMTPRSQRV